METLLRQQVTVWRLKTVDQFGKITFGLPEGVAGHWEDKQTKFFDDEGTEQLSKSVVILECDVRPGDYLALGDFNDKDPLVLGDNVALRVRGFNKFPDLQACDFQRKAFM